MADQADVEQALVAAVTLALYPQGTDAPSIAGPVCRVHRGWPVAGDLQERLRQGEVHVAVLPVEGSLRVTTRFPDTWQTGDVPAPTLRAVVDGDAIAFSGAAQAGQLAGVMVGHRAYARPTENGDTPALVAAALAALIRRDRFALASGAVVSVPGATRLLARVVANHPAWRELRRQAQGFRVAFFCPGPALRDAAVAAIDTHIAARHFLDLADGSVARLAFTGTTTLDEAREAALFRRDLVYTAEYATTAHGMQAAMLFGSAGLGVHSHTF